MAHMGHTERHGVAPVAALPQSPLPNNMSHSPAQQRQESPTQVSPTLLSADFVTKAGTGQNMRVTPLDFSSPLRSASFKNLIPPIFNNQSSQKNLQSRDDQLARPYQVDGTEHVQLFDAARGAPAVRRNPEQDSGVQDSGKKRTGMPTLNYRQGAPPIQNSDPTGTGAPEEEYEKFCLGIVWVLKSGRLLVAGFNPRSTAHNLGVRSGDILKSVDGIEVLNLEADIDGRHDAGELMIGREDTQCKLTLLRLVTKEDAQKLYQIDVTIPRSISVMDLNVQSY